MNVKIAAPGGIPRAVAGTITDADLERAAEAANAIREGGAITEEGAALFLLIAGPAFEELLKRRRAAEVIGDMLDLDNVHFFPARRAG